MKVVKAWTINGVDYTNENKPAGYSATLTLEGVEKSFGKEYSGYVEGEYLAIGETKVEVPDGCTNVATGDLGTKILAKGLNTFTITNTVTCGATVKVVKAWTINGTAYAHGTQPQGYAAQLTLSGKAGSFGETYGGYVEGNQVTIGEDVVVPQGCVNVKSGDLGTKTLARGANVFTVLNTVRCETPPPPPPPTTTVEVLKQDDETGEVLEGAEFQAYTDNGSTVGVLDSRDTPIGSPVLTDAAGVARWTGLTYGSYLVEEVAAPTGYGLPKETVQAVTVDARNAGGVVRLVFIDPAQGTMKVTKAAYELLGGEWVESDGVVGFGDQVKYVVTLTADGPKIHHDVVVSDYIPGNDPDDTTSDTLGIYVAGTAACVEAGECTVTFDSAEQLLTWELGDLRDETRSVEFVIEFPQPGDESSTATGLYTETLANTAAATWNDRDGAQEVGSNEVVVDAELEIAPVEEVVPPPVKPRPPAEILPETGAPSDLGLWTTLGGLMLVLGAGLLLAQGAGLLADRPTPRRRSVTPLWVFPQGSDAFPGALGKATPRTAGRAEKRVGGCQEQGVICVLHAPRRI